MAKTPNVRNIQLEDDVVLALLKQGLDKGFKNFKSYAEYILKQHALLAALRDLQAPHPFTNRPLTPDEVINPNY